MLQEEVVDHQSQQLPLIEEMSSTLHDEDDDQIFQLCDAEFIQDTTTLQSSEATSCPKLEEQEEEEEEEEVEEEEEEEEEEEKIIMSNNSCNHEVCLEEVIYTSSITATSSSNIMMMGNGGQLQHDDISASIDFSSSPDDIDHNHPPYFMPTSIVFTTQDEEQQQQQHQENMESLIMSMQQPPHTIPLTTTSCGAAYSVIAPTTMLTTFPPFEQDSVDCLSNSLPPPPPTTSSYMSTSALLNPTPSSASYVPGNNASSVDASSSTIFILLNNDMQTQELDYPPAVDKTALYNCSDTLSSCLYNNPTNLQAFCSESQNLMTPHVNTTPLATEISTLEDSTYKVGKLSVEQRKEKIHRYMKKRNERNFNKKIKYACRKTLADSRPRVRGRFAKNDDFGEALRSTVCSTSHHDQEDDKDDLQVDVKEEDDILDTSDIFAHISGVNSFKCNFPMIQSWI